MLQVKSIVIPAIVEGTKGSLKATIIGLTTTEKQLQAALTIINKYEDITILLPMAIEMEDGTTRDVCVTESICVLEDAHIKYTIRDREEEMMQDKFSDIEKLLVEASESIKDNGGHYWVNRILHAPASEVYKEMMLALEEIRRTLLKKGTGLFGKMHLDKLDKALRINKLYTTLNDKTNTLLEESEDKKSTLARLTSLVIITFRKTAVLVRGVIAFTIDTSIILTTMTTRIVVSASREVWYAGKAISVAFVEDIVVPVKAA